MYQNLVQIHYILDMNKEILRYWDYNEFDPSKWSLDIRHLDRTMIEYLTWSTVNNSAQWKILTDILMDGMLDNNSKFHPKKEFKRVMTMNDRSLIYCEPPY